MSWFGESKRHMEAAEVRRKVGFNYEKLVLSNQGFWLYELPSGFIRRYTRSKEESIELIKKDLANHLSSQHPLQKPESIDVSYPKEFGEIVWALIKTTDAAGAYHKLLYDTKLRKEYKITVKQIKSAVWDAQFRESIEKAKQKAVRKKLKQRITKCAECGQILVDRDYVVLLNGDTLCYGCDTKRLIREQ